MAVMRTIRLLLIRIRTEKNRDVFYRACRVPVTDSVSDLGYGLTWDRVDLARKLVTIPKSKNGRMRHIPLNSVALAAYQKLFGRSQGSGKVFVNIQGEP